MARALSAFIALKADQEPVWITIEAADFSESWWGTLVSGLETFGVTLSTVSAGVTIYTALVAEPTGLSKVGTVAGLVGAGVGVIVWKFFNWLNPLQVTYRSQVLMDVADKVAVVTVSLML